MQVLITILVAAISWIIVLAGLMLSLNLPRILFIIVHYVLDIGIFGAAFYFLFKQNPNLSPFTTMVVAMITLFVLEFVFWKYIYTGSQNFLTLVDWIIPAFLIASTIYLIGKFVI